MRYHNCYPVVTMFAQKTEHVHVVCHSEAKAATGGVLQRLVECTWLRLGTDRLVCIDITKDYNSELCTCELVNRM